MTLDERTWRAVPAHLEGAGWFEARMRVEVEIRKLLLEIKRLEGELAVGRAALKLACERLREPVRSIDHMGHQEMATDPLRLEIADAIEMLSTEARKAGE